MIDAQTAGFNGQIVCVVSSKPDAPGIDRAKQADIATEVLDYSAHRKAGKPRAQYEQQLAQILQTYSPDLIICAGWMLVFSEAFLKYFPWRVLNLHPGLLPYRDGSAYRLPDGSYADSFIGLAGANAIQAVLAAKQSFAGSTLHVVTEEVDRGPVVSRGVVRVHPRDTVETLYSRIKAKEHEILVRSLKQLCADEAPVSP